MTLYHTDQSKVCPVCNGTFYRPKGKSNTVWATQRACGRNCSNYLRRKDTTSQNGVSRRIDTEKGKNRRFQ
jgi:hypothetical protein